jgi:hypothetical protein
MIATLKPPKNKHELAKAILSLKNPKIDVLEVLSINDKPQVTRLLDQHARRGPVTVILLRDQV